MDKSVAIKRLHKILGKGFGYRVNPKAAMQEDRDRARAELKASVSERDRLRAEADKRREAILAKDDEFQQRLSAYKAARKRCEELSSMQHSYRITVGNVTSYGFFLVKAEGDNWEEVLEKVGKA